MMQGVEGSRWVEEQGCGGMHEDEMLLLQIVSEEWNMFIPSLKKLIGKRESI